MKKLLRIIFAAGIVLVIFAVAHALTLGLTILIILAVLVFIGWFVKKVFRRNR